MSCRQTKESIVQHPGPLEARNSTLAKGMGKSCRDDNLYKVEVEMLLELDRARNFQDFQLNGFGNTF